jgi:hypothetical protein
VHLRPSMQPVSGRPPSNSASAGRAPRASLATPLRCSLHHLARN